MLREETDSERAFRADLRAWLEANLTAELRHSSFRKTPAELKGWFRALSERGLAAPHWPKIYGGMGATPVEQIILIEELARIGAPDLPAQGLTHISPLLMKYGTEEQKREHLPKARTGEVIWAQGYSEPGSGSDLLSLRTRAQVKDDKLVINGHKIWTTGAHYADWLYVLVRTGEGKSRDSITFVLCDAKTPGITARGIKTLAGDDELCEVFFDDVEVPLKNVVGKINEGWTVATALLTEERVRSGNPIMALRALCRLREAAALTGADRDPWMIDRLARAEVEVMALESSYLDALEQLEAGVSDPEESSRLKIHGSEVTQFVLEIMQELGGPHAATRTASLSGNDRPDYSQFFMQSRRLSIRGGTNEIQRGILAMRTLGLPRPGRA